MAKRDRIGKPRPGSQRFEAAARGITEAQVRRERALAKGVNPKTVGRGHARPDLNEISPGVAKDMKRFARMTEKQKEAFAKRVYKDAKKFRMSPQDLWTLLVSPNGKRK